MENDFENKERSDERHKPAPEKSSPWYLREIPLTLLLGALGGAINITYVSRNLPNLPYINVLFIWVEEAPLFSMRTGWLMGEGAIYGSLINLIMVGIIGYQSADKVEKKGIVITSILAGCFASVLAAMIRLR